MAYGPKNMHRKAVIFGYAAKSSAILLNNTLKWFSFHTSVIIIVNLDCSAEAAFLHSPKP